MVGEAEQELLFHLLQLAAFDLPVARALVEAEREELVVAAKALGEELVDESHVVVELAYLENLSAAEPKCLSQRRRWSRSVHSSHSLPKQPRFQRSSNIAEQLDPESVGVELVRRRGGHA